MTNDSEVLDIIAEFIAESIQSKDETKQLEAIQISEYMAWKLKSLDEHRDFLRDCGGLLVDAEMSWHSLLRITWKIRFWQSFEEPLRSLLKDCDLMLTLQERQQVLMIDCPNATIMSSLSQYLPVLSIQIYKLTGHVKQVTIGLEHRL